MRIHSRIAAVLLCGLLAGSSLATAKDKEGVILKVPKGWKPVIQDNPHGLVTITLAKNGDDITDPKELLELQSGPKLKKAKTAEETYQLLKAASECKDVVWNEIKKDANSITFEMKTATCRKEGPEVELRKIIVSKDTFWVITYSNKTDELTPLDRATWINYLDETVLAAAHR